MRAFFAYEGLRAGTAQQLTTTVPTAAQRMGNFLGLVNAAGAPVTIYNPFTTTTVNGVSTRAAFTGNVITPGLIDPVGQAILNYYPLPNQAGNAAGQNNYFAQGTQQQSINQFDSKANERINDKNSFFARYSHRVLVTTPAILFPSANDLGEGLQNQRDIDNAAAADYTYAPNSRFFFDFRAGFARVLLNYAPISLGFNPSSTLGFPSYIAANADHLLFPGVAPANYYGLGDAAQGQTRHDSYSTQLYGVTANGIFGNHALKLGGEFRVLRANVNESGNSTGQYNTNPSYTQGPTPTPPRLSRAIPLPACCSGRAQATSASISRTLPPKVRTIASSCRTTGTPAPN